MTVAVGDIAPPFELPDETGTLRSLDEFCENGPLVLFFYPKDDTPICTKEACRFRDEYQRFQEHQAQVVGVSESSEHSHQRFQSGHGLPFPLLTDAGGRVAELYGLGKTLGLIAKRTTLVIDTDRRVRHLYTSAFNYKAHVDGSLKALKRLQPA